MFWNSAKNAAQGYKSESLEKSRGVSKSPMIAEPKQTVSHSLPGGRKGLQMDGPNTKEENFSLNLKDPTDPAGDKTLLWAYSIPQLVANQKRIILSLDGGELYILGIPTSEFPSELYVYSPYVAGYKGPDGNPTSKIGILRLRQIIPTVENGVTLYTLIYSLMDPQLWDMGLGRNMALQFGDAQGPFQGPLSSQLNLQLRILHVAY